MAGKTHEVVCRSMHRQWPDASLSARRENETPGPALLPQVVCGEDSEEKMVLARERSPGIRAQDIPHVLKNSPHTERPRQSQRRAQLHATSSRHAVFEAVQSASPGGQDTRSYRERMVSLPCRAGQPQNIGGYWRVFQ